MRTQLRRTLLLPWLRRPARRWARRPFGRLVGHFLNKMIRGGQDAASSDLELGAGAMLGLLAAPGAFTSLLMLDKYSAFLNWMRGRLRDDLYVTSIPDKYLFLSVAMAVTGIVTVLKWDTIVPDAQDYQNLAPLPVTSRRILLANAIAILTAVLVVAVDVNLVPTVLFPMFVMAAARSTFGAFASFAAVHAGVVVLASLFSIASVFAILGVFSAALPRATFRAWSPWLRGALLLGLLALLMSGFAGASLVGTVVRHPESWLRWLPSLWFLELYQEMQGRGNGALAGMGSWAWRGLAGVCALVAATYALSYRRRFAGVMEGEARPSEQRGLRVVLWVLDAFAERRPGFERAAHGFATRALLRNETHRLAVAVGLGWMAAAQDGRGAALGCAYLLVLGLRVAFELPAGVPANWIFRVTLDAARTETAGVARRVMLSFVAPLVLAPAVAGGLWESGPVYAVGHGAYVLALSLVLMEAMLAGYRKAPLTCPMPGFRDNFLMLCLGAFVGYEVFTRAGHAIEQWMWAAPWRFALVPAAMWAAWRWNRRRLAEAREAGELEEGLTFENAVVRAVTRLDLGG